MHRPAAIAVLALAVLVPGSQAQMRGGAGHGGVRGSAPMAAPARAGFVPGQARMPGGRFLNPGTGSHSGGWVGNRGFHHQHFHKSFVILNNGCYYGYCGYPYYGYGAYYAPPIFSGFDSTPAYDYGAQGYTAAAPAYNSYDNTALQVQIQHLTDEVEQLREEQQARNQPPPQAQTPARPSRMDLPTILVYRDGRVSQVTNYGIVGQTLWLLDEQRAKKVPLSDLDLAATQAANEDRGGFVVPK